MRFSFLLSSGLIMILMLLSNVFNQDDPTDDIKEAAPAAPKPADEQQS